MKNIFKISLVATALTFFTGCETVQLEELLENPNNITVESADPSFVLNDIQLTFRGIINQYNDDSMRLIRMRNQFSTYNGIVDPLATNTVWQQSYQMFGNIDLLEGIHALSQEEDEGFPLHLGVAQTIEAYSYMLLVDYMDAVPFSEANQPEVFQNPNLDSGSSVYDAQIALLDEAIANLSVDSPKKPQDLYYTDFDAEKWIALANTLKIRAYNNIRLVDPSRAAAGINAALNNNIIDELDEDFQFPYSSNGLPVESRHPFFTESYQAAGAGFFMSNGLLDMLNAGDDQPPFVEEGEVDPRTRYYLYRQSSSAPSGSNLPCDGNSAYDYCYVGNLYTGRDHADDEGIPNDGFKRTTWGVYPGGGAFDRDLFEQARGVTESLEGAGILPIFLSSFTHFVLAEANLTLGTNGNAATYLEQGIRLSMEKVEDFGSAVSTDGFEMTAADIDAYVTRVLAEYNGADANGKLQIVEREYFLAAFGNGIEPYNTYRRTGMPALQSPIIAAGPFPRSFNYPADETSGNPNIESVPPTRRVFWDNNAPGFID